MPTVAERLVHIDSKIERAKKHIADLKTAVAAFIATDPYKIGTKEDAQAGQLIYYVTSVKEVSPCIRSIAGEIIQCLVSALDRLAFQLVCSYVGENPPNRTAIYFPFGWSLENYNSRKGGKMEGAPPDVIKAIDELQPYKTGAGNDIWALCQLNNIDKHRLLLTVGAHVAGIDLGQLILNAIPRAESRNYEMLAKFLPSMNKNLIPADKGFPLKVGDVVLTVPLEPKNKGEQKFTFDVALGEAEVFESQSVVVALNQLTALVEGIVTGLTPKLRSTP